MATMATMAIATARWAAARPDTRATMMATGDDDDDENDVGRQVNELGRVESEREGLAGELDGARATL